MIRNFKKAKRLQGIWGRDENWAEFTVKVTPTGIAVSARDIDDGESFVVTNVAWDGEALTFDALTPSTGWLISHRFTPSRGATVQEATTFRETLQKRKPTSARTSRRVPRRE